MPSTAKILRFRAAVSIRPLSEQEVFLTASEFLASAASGRDWSVLLNPDTLLKVITLLSRGVNAGPEAALERAVEIHEWIKNSGEKVGLFDERDFFLGETAMIAGGASRLLGRFDSAETWLDVADAAFRHTVNPAPLTAKVQYQRLALRYDLRRFTAVRELAPSLRASFERLGMETEAHRTAFLEAVALKDGGESEAAFERFVALRGALTSNEGGVLVSTLVELGAHFGRNGDYKNAVASFEEAERHLSQSAEPAHLAHLKASIAEAYRGKGELNAAVDAFRLAIKHYLSIGMQSMAAYLRVVTAETLIAANRDREAEWELLAAMPVIEEQNLVTEGVAALALLRESLSKRSIDRRVLGELRGHLSTLN